MALATGDVIQVSLRGTLYGQRILNILHYVITVPHTGSDIDQLKDIATSIAADTGSQQIAATLLALVTADYKLDDVRAQRVYPTRSVYQQTANGNVGTDVGNARSVNSALSITKQGDRAGRKGIGRIQIAGISSNDMVSGLWDVTGLAGQLGDFINCVKASYTTAATPITMAPVIFNPTGPVDFYSPILAWTVQEEIRTMHRRTVRLGE